MDLAVVLDTSGSTRNDRFFSIQNFVADLIDLLEIGPDKTHIAALYFSDTTQVCTQFLQRVLRRVGSDRNKLK